MIENIFPMKFLQLTWINYHRNDLTQNKNVQKMIYNFMKKYTKEKIFFFKTIQEIFFEMTHRLSDFFYQNLLIFVYEIFLTNFSTTDPKYQR